MIVAKDRDDLAYLIRKIYEEYGKWGMKVNTDKMKYMCIGGPSSTVEVENGDKILHYSECNYLGVTLDVVKTWRMPRGRSSREEWLLKIRIRWNMIPKHLN